MVNIFVVNYRFLYKGRIIVLSVTCPPLFTAVTGNLLIPKSVHNFYRTKGYLRIFDGVALKATHKLYEN